MTQSDKPQPPEPPKREEQTLPHVELQYRRRVRPEPRVPLVLQSVIGFGAWLVGLAACAVGIQFESGIVPIIAFGAILGSAIYLPIQFGWRGYIPGLLMGLGLTILIPLAICGLIWIAH